jgi:hypothetical protein
MPARLQAKKIFLRLQRQPRMHAPTARTRI